MKVKFEFTDGKTETYDAGDIIIKIKDGICFPSNEDEFEDYVDTAIIQGGVFEIPPDPHRSLIKKIKINSHAVKKVILIDDEKKS